METKSSSVVTAEAPEPAVAAEAAPPMEVTSEAPEEPAAPTPVAVEEAPTPAAVVEDAPTPAVAEEKPSEEMSEEANEVAADEPMETEAKDVTPAVTEPSDAAAVTEPKPVVEDTPATKAPAPSVAELKKTEAGPTLKPGGRKAASKDIEHALAVIQEQNIKESKKAPVKVAENLAAQVQCVQPIWTRKPDEIKQREYDKFYESTTKAMNGPMTQTHFIAEGEVTIKSLVPLFPEYGQAAENIERYIRGVFITDDFKDMMPSYLSFVKGVDDSDDLPLDVSRETLRQHKLLKPIEGGVDKTTGGGEAVETPTAKAASAKPALKAAAKMEASPCGEDNSDEEEAKTAAKEPVAKPADKSSNEDSGDSDDEKNAPKAANP
jgi:hypothetical protein